MSNEPSPNASWADIVMEAGAEPTVSYRTAMAVYEESLIRGQFMGRGWIGAGFLNFYDGRLNPQEHPTPQAFWLEIDGQLLASDWEWLGLEKTPAKSPQGHDQLHAVITLRHTVRPVSVKVHTLLDGTPVLTRWLEVINTGSQPAALATAHPWSGVLQRTKRWREHLAGGAALYSVGYFENPHWGNEGDFQWRDLPMAAGYHIDGRYRKDRHRHPWFVLRNHATGEHFIGQLAWSGGYRFEFDVEAGTGTSDQPAKLFFRGGPDAPAPLRVLAPGQSVSTPAMHLGLTFGGLDDSIHAMHDHLRKSVFLPQPRGRGCWVESAIGPEIEITHDYVMHCIDMAGDIGSEVFFVDASWYAPPRSYWWDTVGDWKVDPQRFPQGIKPFRDRIHAKGMLWGLWMDAERIGKKCRVTSEHPDWVARAYDGAAIASDLIDLTNPAAAHWMEEQIAAVIAENQLDFFRLDYNVGGLGGGLRTLRNGYIENGYWRYYEALYAIYERLRGRFPNVILENCAGGGGRTDLGMVRLFSHTWVTDWQIAPRSFAITNGMTMALPPEYVDRLLGGQSGHSTAEFDFQWRLLLFVRPTVGFFHPLGADWNPHMLQRLRHFIGLYKEFVRPFMPTGRIYHHTPTVNNPEPRGWGVLELASADRTRAICGLFQLAAPVQPEYRLRLRGLDVGRNYRVTFDNAGTSCVISGFTLMQEGLTIRLEGALTSELLRIEAQ